MSSINRKTSVPQVSLPGMSDGFADSLPAQVNHCVPQSAVCSLFLFEGSASDVQSRVGAILSAYPDATEVSAEETTRHRNWLRQETGGFQTAPAAAEVTRGLMITTESSSTPGVPETLQLAAAQFQVAGLTKIGFICADTREVPWAVGIAACSGSSQGVVGTLGGSRGEYFQVLQHLFYLDDPQGFAQDLVSEKVVGQVPYIHREQWSESTAPLRLAFQTSDPDRDGWGLLFGSESGEFLRRNGFVPPPQTCITVHVSWLTAMRLLLAGEEHGIDSYMDEDGQWMLSGYALHRAGVIDEHLRPIGALTQEQCTAFQLGNPPSEAQAMVSVMKLYLQLLSEYLQHIREESGPRELLAHVQEHILGAGKWLIEHGHIAVVHGQPGSGLVN